MNRQVGVLSGELMERLDISPTAIFLGLYACPGRGAWTDGAHVQPFDYSIWVEICHSIRQEQGVDVQALCEDMKQSSYMLLLSTLTADLYLAKWEAGLQILLRKQRAILAGVGQ